MRYFHFPPLILILEMTVSVLICAAPSMSLQPKWKKNPRTGFPLPHVFPLPNIELAIQEAFYSLHTLGACGVKLASQSQGHTWEIRLLIRLWNTLTKKKQLIIIHPSKPQAVPEGCFTSKPLPLLEFITDTTRAVINLIANGTLERYPNVKVLDPPLWFLSPESDRTDWQEHFFVCPKGNRKADPCQKKAFNPVLRIAGDAFPRGFPSFHTVGEDHILFGGDFPYTPIPMIQSKIQDMKQCPSITGCINKIAYQNAENLFNLSKQ